MFFCLHKHLQRLNFRWTLPLSTVLIMTFLWLKRAICAWHDPSPLPHMRLWWPRGQRQTPTRRPPPGTRTSNSTCTTIHVGKEMGAKHFLGSKYCILVVKYINILDSAPLLMSSLCSTHWTSLQMWHWTMGWASQALRHSVLCFIACHMHPVCVWCRICTGEVQQCCHE